MAGPASTIRNTIIIAGVDSASEAIEKAKNSMKGLEGQTKKTGQAADALAAAPGIDAAKVQGTTQRVGGALAALTAAMGPAGAAIADLGRSATALGSTANIIPGPIGVAAAAIVGIGAAAYLAGKHISENTAKLRLLGSSGEALRLKDKFDLSVDGAVALASAMDSLRDRSVKPSDELIQQVLTHAKAMGADPVEAVKKLAAAWKGGAAAVLEYQKEAGIIQGLDQTAVDATAKRLQIDREAVGLSAAQLTIKDKLNQTFLDAVAASKDLKDAEQSVQDLRERGIKGSSQAIRDAANLQANAKEETLAGLRAQASAADKVVAGTQQAANREKEIADIEKGRGILAGVRDTQAALARTKAIGHGIQLQSIAEQRATVEDQIVLLKMQEAFLSKKDFDNALLALQATKLQLDAKQKAEIEADKAEKKAKAQEALAARAAAMDVDLRRLKARADLDGLQTAQERLAILEKEHAIAINATAGIKGGKARADARLAADDEYATKKRALDRTIADETAKASDDTQKTLEDAARHSADIAQAASDAIVGTAQARSRSLADALRAQGRDEEASLVESRQAQADYQQSLLAIDRERVAALALVAADSTDARNIEIAADQRRLLAAQTLDDVEAKLAVASHERASQMRQDAYASLGSVAAALQQMGQLGNLGAGALGQSMGFAIKSFQDLDKAMSKSKVNISEVGAAIGSAVSGISATVISAETTRTLAQLDNEEKRRLSTAATEGERAAITEEYERKKADAVDAAERKKAAVMILVEGAQAIASAARYDYVGAAGHAAAAVAFGLLAGGSGGSSYTPGAATAGSGGFTSTGTTTSGTGTSGTGKGVTIIQNYNQPLVTAQDIGKSVHGALKSIGNTGYARARGV